MLKKVSNKMRVRGISKSKILDFDCVKTASTDNNRLIKSGSYSMTRSKELSYSKICSKVPVIDYSIDKKRALDVIKRVNVAR